MKRVHYIVLLLFPIVFFSSCGKENRWDCLKRTGDIISETREMGIFYGVRSMDNVNVILVQDTAYYVRVEAGESLIDGIETTIANGFLVVANNNKCNWARSYDHDVNVYVGFTDIDSLDHQGYGTVTSQGTVVTDQLDITIINNGDVDLDINILFCSANMHQAGDLILAGEADWVEIWSSGVQWIRCSNLSVNYFRVVTKTTGNALIHATDSIDVEIAGPGSVYYSGNPLVVNSVITGTGSLVKL